MRPFLALLSAKVRHFVRDRIALFWMFAFPIFLMLLFGFVFGGDEEPVKLRLGVVLGGQGPAFQGLLEGLHHVPVISEVHTGTLEEELSALRARKRDGVLVVPTDLPKALRAGNEVNFKLYYDASRSTTYQVLMSVIQEFLARSEEYLTGTERRFRLETEPVQVRHLRPIDYQVPGILAMALMQLGLFGVGGTLVALREARVLRRFWAAPLSPGLFASSFIAHTLIVSLVQTTLFLATATAVFHVAVLGGYALLVGVVVLGALCFTALGYMIAAFARSAEASSALLQAINFPMMFLSGIFWPLEWMPGILRQVAWIFPLTYLGDALRQVMAGASPLVPLWLDAAVLGAWALISATIAALFFRWE